MCAGVSVLSPLKQVLCFCFFFLFFFRNLLSLFWLLTFPIFETSIRISPKRFHDANMPKAHKNKPSTTVVLYPLHRSSTFPGCPVKRHTKDSNPHTHTYLENLVLRLLWMLTILLSVSVVFFSFFAAPDYSCPTHSNYHCFVRSWFSTYSGTPNLPPARKTITAGLGEAKTAPRKKRRRPTYNP